VISVSVATTTSTYPHFDSSTALPYIRPQTSKESDNPASTPHFYFTATLEISEKHEFLPSYIDSKEPRFIIPLFAVYTVYIAIMNPDTVHCAFRLLHLIETKHQYARNIDASTRRLITLITQSAAHLRPPSTTLEPTPITKENFKADLELLATTIFEQASSQPAAPVIDLNQIQDAVTSAIDKCFGPKIEVLPTPAGYSTIEKELADINKRIDNSTIHKELTTNNSTIHKELTTINSTIHKELTAINKRINNSTIHTELANINKRIDKLVPPPSPPPSRPQTPPLKSEQYGIATFDHNTSRDRNQCIFSKGDKLFIEGSAYAY